MRIVSINLGVTGSTGKIIRGICNKATKKNHEYLIVAPRLDKRIAEKNEYYIGSSFFRRINAYLAIITGLDGCFSVFSTIKTLKTIKTFNPDIIHLHNLHNSYINLPMLFAFIKKNKIRVIWTLHDCWTFTGHCPHFIYENCYKWKEGCNTCPRYRFYPKSLFDNSKFMWKLKRRWFTGISDLTIVTPSKWLARFVEESYLKDYQIKILNNGIDLQTFKYTQSDFREKNNLEGKKIVLGVAFGWGMKKGLDVFIELSKSLPKDYQVILVGTDENVDRKLPENIISIHRTNNQKELAEIYSSADVFVNPTREDTYPTVNMEAISCGVPVISFNTGGCAEIVNEKSGIIVEVNDIHALEKGIISIIENRNTYAESLQKLSKKFDQELKYEEYIKLYEQ